MGKKFQVKLKVILARDASVGVIFRRGPSAYTQLIKWDTANDTFEYGDWFKGTIYPDRSDISPDGKNLVYVAGNWKPPLLLWTAMCRPPFLAPIILWQCENGSLGGGLFENNNSVILNVTPKDIKEPSLFVLHDVINAKPLHLPAGESGYRPLYHERLLKHGWRYSGKEQTYSDNEPFLYFKKIEVASRVLELSVHFHCTYWMHSKNPEYEIRDLLNGNKIYLGRLLWADWDKNGDFLFTENGKLFRWPAKKISFDSEIIRGAVEIADFNYPSPMTSKPI